MNTSNTHIMVRDLNIYYGSQLALENINVDIPRNRVTAIIGPSGCGKTTLLKCFNKMILLTEGIKFSGSVMVDSVDIYNGKNPDDTNVRKRMGLLSQKPCPLPMSIYDNVAYGLRIHGVRDKKKLDEAVEYYLTVVSLWAEVRQRLSSPASILSAGQQQRLCLARGLAVEPEAILGDEPTSALDPISGQRIEQTLVSLKEKYTIVLVTHILRQARRLADYLIFLYMGKLIEHGPAASIFENPKQPETKAYIGGEIS